MDPSVKEFLSIMNQLLSPKPTGIMDADHATCLNQIKKLTQYLKDHKDQFSNTSLETGTINLQTFYCVYEIVDYFGTKKRNAEIQFETYLFAMEFISIFGILSKFSFINSAGTEIFFNQITALDNQYYLYHELLPNLFSKTEELCGLVNSNPEAMMVMMTACRFTSVVTKIIVNHEIQLINEGQVKHLHNSMDHVLKCLVEFLKTLEEETITTGLINTVSELIYRIELSSNLFPNLKNYIELLIPYIVPIKRHKQIERTELRVAVVTAEMDLRSILRALRCFQFKRVIELSEIMLLRLEMNSYYTSDHSGSGAMCFMGFSENFNILADQVLLIFEKLCLWSFNGAVEAAEMIMKVFINFFNLPAKKGWEGSWSTLNERTINVVNSLAALQDSQTFCRLFN